MICTSPGNCFGHVMWNELLLFNVIRSQHFRKSLRALSPRCPCKMLGGFCFDIRMTCIRLKIDRTVSAPTIICRSIVEGIVVGHFELICGSKINSLQAARQSGGYWEPCSSEKDSGNAERQAKKLRVRNNGSSPHLQYIQFPTAHHGCIFTYTTC